MPAPAVAFVIPVYNQRTDWLSECVTSAAEQSIRTEVVLVDDGSSPSYTPLLAPIRHIRHDSNRGIAAALNTGIQASSAEWICWLSSDDAVMPEKAEIQLRITQRYGCLASFHPYYTRHPEGKFFGFDAGDGRIQPAISPAPPRMVRYLQASGAPIIPDAWTWTSILDQRRDFSGPGGCLVNGSTSMIHRSVFEDVGLFDTSYRYGQDWEMWNRIAVKYKWLFISSVMGVRREGANLTEATRKNRFLWDVARGEDARIMETYAP